MIYRAKPDIEAVKYILNHLRKEDEIECRTTLGCRWKKKTLENILNADFNILLGKTKQGDIPVVMGGAWAVNPNYPALATVWMLSTNEIEKHQIGFFRELKKEFQNFDKKYALTFNRLYKTNYLAKSWLKKLGFRFPSEINKNVQSSMDKAFLLNIEIPKDFEIFYRERKVKGLGE